MAETVNKEPEEVIEDLVNQPRNVSTDGGSVTNISVQDAIEADKYLRKKAAGSVNSRGMGVRLGILRGPGHF
ncbi:MAG: hypothetical protein WBK37_00110 [Kiritimatiellia bacterium]|jgi:hypothetical protein|nr:hypothetical protein [Kiritimatiellia bacterium]